MTLAVASRLAVLTLLCLQFSLELDLAARLRLREVQPTLLVQAGDQVPQSHIFLKVGPDLFVGTFAHNTWSGWCGRAPPGFLNLKETKIMKRDLAKHQRREETLPKPES